MSDHNRRSRKRWRRRENLVDSHSATVRRYRSENTTPIGLEHLASMFSIATGLKVVEAFGGKNVSQGIGDGVVQRVDRLGADAA